MINASPASEMIDGQPKAATLLARSLKSAKIAHAYLFRGPDGVGKREAATTFAAQLNCNEQKDGLACRTCPSCRKFFSGNHPDLIQIEPEGAAIKINQIRELKKTLAFPPFEARYRVVVLTDIHTMRREAANSMLKTLEEPPEETILILTGDETGGILPTILSRCQIIPFFALPVDQIARVLQTEEEISPEEATSLAAAAEGSIGRAKILHKNGLLTHRREIIEALLKYPANNPQNVEPILALADECGKLKENLPELFDLLRLWLRDLVIIKTGGSANLITSHDLQQFSTDAIKRWTVIELCQRLEHLHQAERQLARNCNRALVCEVLFFALL